MDNSVSLGEYARQVIEQQFQHIIKQEEGVLEDADPEFLHQMRVGSRRLSTALEVFGKVVQLPKPARQKAVAGLAKSLGKLRDLDVQLITLKEEYSPRLKGNEQRSVNRLFEHLEDKRSHALLAVKRILSEEKYLNLKSEYTQWLAQPNYTPLAEINLELILPDLLSPLLSKLLLHPAWLIPVNDPSPSAALTLHALRKTCKSVRYQAEFFTNFYGADFQKWISQLKSLQDALGKVQDTHVFRKKMTTQFNDQQEFLELDSIIQEDCETALAGWDKIRHQYLDPDFRHGLRLMLITPTRQLDSSSSRH